ncbi:MAG: AAA family ATPase [Flavobacterium sp.]|nr:MAG: AAA family ATPase [Flavobacterium sp.]
MSTRNLLPKDYLIDNQYRVILPIKQNRTTETYRVKGLDNKIYFMKLLKLDKLHKTAFDEDGNILEIEILRTLSHPNIVAFKDSGEILIDERKHSYLILHFIAGETLADNISRTPLSTIYDVKFYAIAILNALKYLHSLPEPVIHNEVTLSNVMLDLSGTIPYPKVIDFGYARPFHRSTKTYTKDELNPFYIASECFSNIFSPQSDVFSVGALMYHLIYGIPPWFIDVSHYSLRKNNLEDIISEERQKTLLFPDVTDKFPDFDDSIVLIIKKALHKDCDLRFKTANEFLKALNGDIEVEDVERMALETSISRNQKTVIKVKGKGFDAIAGMADLKQQLQLDVINALKDPDEYAKYDITIPNGLLLYGPPRCGKTFFAQRFAEEVGFHYIDLKPSDLQSKFINATQENIRKVFEEAEKYAPTILFIDEIDAIAPNREGELHQMHANAVNELLAQLNNTGEKGIFIIGATNRPEKIDPALLGAGRLEKKYYIPPPDIEARKALFGLFLCKKPLDFGIDYDRLSSLTENYVSGDIKLLVDNAARSALNLKARVSMEILEKTIQEIRPTISSSELAKYELLRRKMEGEISTKEDRRVPIGFKTYK